MSFSDELRHLAERAQTLGEQDAIDDRQRSLLVSLFRLLACEEETDVTVEKAAASERNNASARPSVLTQPGERASRRAEAEEGMNVICASGTPVALVRFTGRLQEETSREGISRGEESPEKKAKLLCRSLEASRVRFGILFSGRRLRCYSSFGEPRKPIFDIDLLGHRRHEVQRLRALLEAIVTFGLAKDGYKRNDSVRQRSVGHGLLYVLAVPNGEPFGRRQTTCKIGITGKSLDSRRQFHEWRLGIEGAESMRLCYLAAGAAVAAEKVACRRTAHMAPPGLGPQAEWRWCSPARLVETVKETACNQIREESGRLGLDLAHVTLADPLGPADPLPGGDTCGPDSCEDTAKLPRSESKGEKQKSISQDAGSSFGGLEPSFGEQLSAEDALRRGAEVKQQAIRGTLGKRPEDQILSFRISGHENSLLRECAQQSAYRKRSDYARDQITGWGQGFSITAKAGLVLHWAAAHWETDVRGRKWDQLRGLAEKFFYPQCISDSEVIDSPAGADSRPGGPLRFRNSPHPEGPLRPEGSLQKVLGLAQRHLLAVEPQPLQLLRRQLVKMNRTDELKKITGGPGGPRRQDYREQEASWTCEVRRQVLSVSVEEGCRDLESVRMASAERSVAEKNFSESGYASISGYARNCVLGWNRDPLIAARAAVVLTWLAGRAGRPIGREDWKSLGKAMGDAFGAGHLPGADTTVRDLQVAEEHLLRTRREKVAEDTGIPVS